MMWMMISLLPWDHYFHQDSFATFGVALTRVSVMMTGEEDFTDTFVETIGRNNTKTEDPLNPFPETAFVFAMVFVLLMSIVLMNLLVSQYRYTSHSLSKIEIRDSTVYLNNLVLQLTYVTSRDTNLKLSTLFGKPPIYYYPASRASSPWRNGWAPTCFFQGKRLCWQGSHLPGALLIKCIQR